MAAAAVIDHFLLFFACKFEAPPPLQNVTHSFAPRVRRRPSFLHHSSLHRFFCFIKCPRRERTSRTLAASGEVTAGAGSAPSAHRDALQQPLSRGERSKLLTAVGGGGGSGGGGGGKSLQLPFPPEEGRSNIRLRA